MKTKNPLIIAATIALKKSGSEDVYLGSKFPPEFRGWYRVTAAEKGKLTLERLKTKPKAAKNSPAKKKPAK